VKTPPWRLNVLISYLHRNLTNFKYENPCNNPFASLFTACCSDRDCLPGRIRQIVFVGFDAAELDTIELASYERSDIYNHIVNGCSYSVDSLNSVRNGDSVTLYLDNSGTVITNQYKYKLSVRSTGLVVSISDVTDKQSDHHVCICDCVIPDCYNPIVSYNLDGRIITNDNLIIKK
jgi:hypothetical protein